MNESEHAVVTQVKAPIEDPALREQIVNAITKFAESRDRIYAVHRHKSLPLFREDVRRLLSGELKP